MTTARGALREIEASVETWPYGPRHPIRVTEEVLEAGGGDSYPEYREYEATAADIASKIREGMRLPEDLLITPRTDSGANLAGNGSGTPRRLNRSPARDVPFVSSSRKLRYCT